MPVGRGREVIQRVGERGREGAVVLRADEDEAVRLLDLLHQRGHPLGRGGLLLGRHEVEGRPHQRGVDLQGV